MGNIQHKDSDIELRKKKYNHQFKSQSSWGWEEHQANITM